MATVNARLRMKWMRLCPGIQITIPTKITSSQTLSPTVPPHTLTGPGKCIMIWSPDASLCASLLSSSLGTKVSFQGNNKAKNYNVGRWQCNVDFVLCDDKIARWNETIVREDKLIKTVVVHNGNYPIRYYMFLFPDTPQFQTDLGEPLVLTPLIQSGQTQRARQELQCY